MKLEQPPIEIKFKEVFQDYIDKKFENFLRVSDDRYVYWDILKYRKNLPYPEDTVKSWSLLKFHRSINYKSINFGEKDFYYYITENIQQNLHEFDLKLIGGLYKTPITQNDKAE